jgi:hypothetical protein
MYLKTDTKIFFFTAFDLRSPRRLAGSSEGALFCRPRSRVYSRLTVLNEIERVKYASFKKLTTGV